jgi:hypothetical protein
MNGIFWRQADEELDRAKVSGSDQRTFCPKEIDQ